MRLLLFPLIPALTCCAQELTPAQDSHHALAQDILQYLSDTEICLSTCVDPPSVSAAIPQLKQLAKRARDLAARQQELDEPAREDLITLQLAGQARSLAGIMEKLDEPSRQKLIAMERDIKRFNTLWAAIRQHLDRLEENNLMTPELRDILRVAPPRQSQHTHASS